MGYMAFTSSSQLLPRAWLLLDSAFAASLTFSDPVHQLIRCIERTYSFVLDKCTPSLSIKNRFLHSMMHFITSTQLNVNQSPKLSCTGKGKLPGRALLLHLRRNCCESQLSSYVGFYLSLPFTGRHRVLTCTTHDSLVTWFNQECSSPRNSQVN